MEPARWLTYWPAGFTSNFVSVRFFFFGGGGATDWQEMFVPDCFIFFPLEVKSNNNQIMIDRCKRTKSNKNHKNMNKNEQPERNMIYNHQQLQIETMIT